MSQLNYKKIQNPKSETEYAIEINSGGFSGVVYSYNKVQLLEQNDNLTIKYGYDIIDDNGIEIDLKLFEEEISLILEELLYSGLQNNSIIYTGGVDDN